MLTLLVLFFFSGAAALVYQVVWLRQLVLVVGSTTAAVSTVVAVFMAGLGLGAWLFGRVADRTRSPLRLYAYLELGVALYALALPALISASVPLYVELARPLAGQPASLTLLRAAQGFALLFAPTLLMGGTLPLLVRAVGRSLARLGHDLGALYAANIAGGVFGSLVCGFVLIRWLGVSGATMVAVLGNLLVAVMALLLSRRAETAGAEPPGEAEAAEPAPAGGGGPASARARLLWATVFLSGFLTLSYEVIWTRVLVFSFHSTVYAFTLILATFLTGLALGSRLFVVLERRGAPPLLSLGVTQALAGSGALLLTPLAARSNLLIGLVTDQWGATGWPFLAGSALTAASIMLLPATLMGVALPLGMRLLVDDLGSSGRRIGGAYLVNTAGSVAGSLLAGFALIPGLGLKGALVATAALQLALAVACLRQAEVAPGRRWTLAAGATGLFAATLGGDAMALRGPAPFDVFLAEEGRPPPVVLAHVDDVGSSLSVARHADGRHSLRIDGFEAAANSPTGDAGYMPMMSHLPLLLHPKPERVLVICFGTGATAGAVLDHPGSRVDVVDINPGVFALAPYFEAVNHGVARSPLARLVVDDGRNYLLTSEERYDVITSEPMPPRFAGVVNLYSLEYYELARERLKPGGLMVQWLPFHLVSYEESLRILATVQQVFPETTLWLHSVTGLIVARRDRPVELDVERVGEALGREPLGERMAALGVRSPLDLAALHLVGPEQVRLATEHAGIISDDRPSLEFHEPRHPVLEFRGPYTLDQARVLEVLLQLRLRSAAPLGGASPELAAACARQRVVQSHRTLGDTYFFWGSLREAGESYAAAAAAALDPALAAELLLLASDAAARAGDPAAARRLAREALERRPDDPEARQLLELLGAAPES